MTRNKIAAGLAFVSAILFIISGYQANISIYRAIESTIQHAASKEIWQAASLPINALAIVAQLGGFAVLAGALLFLKNHITSGKLLVMIGTGQGIITILISLVIDLVQGGTAYATNYVLWLSTSATGVGILFSIIARTLAKPASQKVAK